jgi:hypothetical protein
VSLDSFWSDIFEKYGVTPAEYRAMFRAQGGRCFVCRKAKGKSRRLAVDHNHETGEVRGLVCSGSRDPKTCNRLIAFYTRDALLRAAEMLSDPPPARAVLSAIRQDETGDPLIPSVVGNPPFRLHEVLRSE